MTQSCLLSLVYTCNWVSCFSRKRGRAQREKFPRSEGESSNLCKIISSGATLGRVLCDARPVFLARGREYSVVLVNFDSVGLEGLEGLEGLVDLVELCVLQTIITKQSITNNIIIIHTD
jgi:hypothetical protein